MRHPALPLVLLLAFAGSLSAQEEGGRYQPIAAWTTPYVEHLIRAGVIRDPDPLTRPLRRTDLARALREADTTSARGSVRQMVRLLSREFEAAATDSVRWQVEAALGLLAASDARRWAERPSADSAGMFPQGALTASLELPHLSLVTRPAFDARLRYDPDYAGMKNRTVAGRQEEAYLLYSSRYADAFVGTVDRNWGPPELQGLMLSPSPYGFDHLLARIGPARLRLEMLVSVLDELSPWPDTARGSTARTGLSRLLTLHRIVVTPSDAVAFSLFEGVVYASSPDTSRFLDPRYLNPLNVFYAAQSQGVRTGNCLVGIDASVRVARSARVSGQFYLDDFQIDHRSLGDREPPSYGFTLVGTGGWLRGAASWTALYTRVTNLAYRTTLREEQLTRLGVGIARDFSDYDQATFRAAFVPVPRLLASAELTLIRQGAGDMRAPYPDTASYAATKTFLVGVVERTTRVAAQASWTPRPEFTLAVDLGRHFLANAGHVDGASQGRWVWRVRGEVRRGWGGALR